MRDVNRIDSFLEALGELWKKYPDMRFGQLVMSIETGDQNKIWNQEDEEWLKLIENMKNK